MTRDLPVYKVTSSDLLDTCSFCGFHLCAGDLAIDVYGDIYHLSCWDELLERSYQKIECSDVLVEDRDNEEARS
jgi:predicted nucleic acid-binding protein